MRSIGIDPGQSGGAVWLGDNGEILGRMKFAGATDHDIALALAEWGQEPDTRAIIEQVHAMPKQGVSSTFKFGRSFGFLIGCLTALEVPYTLVTPAKWQGALGCRTRGDKNVSKAAAQRRWPKEKWTHALADAALIAEYGRRQEKGGVHL